MNNKPGRMQMRILEPMGRNGGTWPATWTLNYRDNQLMLGLKANGYVDFDGFAWKLTAQGRSAIEERPKPSTPKVDRRKKDWAT